MSEKKGGHFKEVDQRVDINKLELGVLKYWDKEKVFEATLAKNKDKETFTFYDGPPYATGKPHYGHILQSAIKDTVLRYKTMRGFNVPRRVGWDCHGLPVETLVEKELGFKSKKDIEEYGIEEFNQKCRDTVFRYIDEFTDTLKRMGRWAEYDNAYATLDIDYMESEWWVVKQLWEQEMLYQAFRSTPYCIRCATPLSNFEVSLAYQDKTDTAVYVLLKGKRQKAKGKGAGQKSKVDGDTYLLIWTTTPWTLPGNAAVAFSEDEEVEYVVVNHEGKNIVIAEKRVKDVFGEDAEVMQEISIDELKKFKYEPLYPEVAENMGADREKMFSLVPGDHVTADDGTGLVHMAPAFGEEDFEICKREGLPILRTVDTEGNFIQEVTKWAGENIFAANQKIVKDLDERELLFKKEKYRHSYPFCWRCDEPLIYYALDTWFVKVNKIKDQMLSTNEQINWTPKHVQHGRFGKGIESAPDWAVSRNRYWSVPVPVWECDKCDSQMCVGSIEELKKVSGVAEVKDLHRPYVDDIQWECGKTPSGSPLSGGANLKCIGTMKRIPEVLDAWFDSGSMPYSQWHYPFENKELVEANFPADFIVEGLDQTRAWFYVLHVLANALTTSDIGLGKSSGAFMNAIASGLIFAEDGKKLSKKLKNFPDLDPTMELFGADVLRLYLLSSSSLGEPYRFSEKGLRQVQRNAYLTLWNVYSFFVRYANVNDWEKDNKVKSNNLLDVWILTRIKHFEAYMISKTDVYQVDDAARAILPFIDDLSNWYVRRSRGRFQHGASDQDKNEALSTLYEVLVRFSRVIAPFMPFVSEEIFMNLTGGDSVHLENLDDSEGVSQDEQELVDEMISVREIISAGLALRAKEGIKVRQPLGTLFIKGDELRMEMMDMISDEMNVKTVKYVDVIPADENIIGSDKEAKVQTGLDTYITEELKAEGTAREIIRHAQLLRRKAGYELDDRISLSLIVESGELKGILEGQQEMISEALQADEVIYGEMKIDETAEIKIDGEIVVVGVNSHT